MKKYYLCGITFRHELGHTNCDGYIHESIEELKNHHSCWEECGIVEIEVEDGKLPESYSSHKWVVPEDLDWRKYQTVENGGYREIRRFGSGDSEENED